MLIKPSRESRSMKHIRLWGLGIYRMVVLIFIFYVPFIYTTQVIPSLINPQIGENLWGMNYRQSITQDDILNTVTLSCPCDFFITHTDIDNNGGGFTITQPGNWCVSEDLVTSSPIIINASPVYLDLKGRTISSSVIAPGIVPAPIIQVATQSGTVIKNGNLIGLDQGSTLGVRAGVQLVGSNNCIIENISFTSLGSVDNTGGLQTSYGFETSIGDSGNIFRNCFASGVYLQGFRINGTNTTLP